MRAKSLSKDICLWLEFSIEEKSTGSSVVWGDWQCLLVLFDALLVGGSGWHSAGLKDHKPPGRLLQQVPAVEHAGERCVWWTSPNHLQDGCEG